MSDEEKLYKQVIVLRKDLNMRKGKIAAQAAHASRGASKFADDQEVSFWEMQGQTKIVVGVEGKEELLELYKEVNNDGLPAKLVEDLAHTEFDERKLTAVGIGPCLEDEIDEYTSHLNLL